jgi:AraC-like DNA-binding protein
MPACHRHYPGRSDGAYSLVYLHRHRPSLCNSQVGSCNCCFGACSACTRVMACTLAESPSDPLHRKLRQLRCLRCRFDCYRVERTSSRAGFAPAEVQRLSRRTVTTAIKVQRAVGLQRHHDASQKAAQKKLSPGLKVVLKTLPPGFIDDFPAEDQRAISEAVGKPIILNGYEDDGRAELEFTDGEDVRWGCVYSSAFARSRVGTLADRQVFARK